ncbi:MAG TPA: alpha/beta hydrolase [Candidatus Dormibacteraeota bacterium]|nr:alpha/beta hydrolase [Candidatus Dormibacteraeota bacterium]
MRTERLTVARDIELAVDRWPPTGAETRRPSATSGDHVPASVPFLLVHGLASNARMWDGVAVRLAASGHEAITVDLRGHARSSKPDGPYDIPAVAADLATLIERLSLDRPVVAGQSWGGNVVLELAATRPELVTAIVLVDGGWLDPSRWFPDWESCRAALAPPRLVGRPLREVEGFLRSAHADWPETGIRGALANFEVREDGTIAPWLTFDRHIAVLRGLWEHHPAARYGSVTVPVLLVPADGDDHERLDRKRQEVSEAAAALPDAQVHWIAGDHDIHAQRPDELAAVMLESLREEVAG